MRNGADGEIRTLVGQMRPAVYETAAVRKQPVAAEPHRVLAGQATNGGSPRIRTVFSPVKSRDFTIKVCNPGGRLQRPRREGGVEPPQPGL